LDTDPPSGALAPQTHANLTFQALKEEWSEAKYLKAIDVHKRKRQS
jgi:hypothetical protein